MKPSIPSAFAGAKESVYPSPGQALFLEAVRAAVEQLVRQGARVARHRRGSPEQVVCAFVVEVLRTALRYAAVARTEGRPLRIEQPPGWSTITLVVGDRPAKVIELAEYRKRRA